MHLADKQLSWSPLNRPPRIINARDGRLHWERPRKVVIYGAGLGRDEAPLTDPEWVVWALNVIPPMARIDEPGGIMYAVRADCWWDIHQRRAQSLDDLRWIAACPVPIMVPTDLLDASPNAVRYPIERVRREVADGPFACTFAYQIAYALLEGFTDIGLYGVELAYGTMRERTVEYASVSWWMGYAEAKGVTFHLPAHSRLGTHRFLYGLEYDDEIRDVKAYEYRLAEGDAHQARVKDQRASVGG